jgi:hypothetical protein
MEHGSGMKDRLVRNARESEDLPVIEAPGALKNKRRTSVGEVDGRGRHVFRPRPEWSAGEKI